MAYIKMMLRIDVCAFFSSAFFQISRHASINVHRVHNCFISVSIAYEVWSGGCLCFFRKYFIQPPRHAWLWYTLYAIVFIELTAFDVYHLCVSMKKNYNLKIWLGLLWMIKSEPKWVDSHFLNFYSRSNNEFTECKTPVGTFGVVYRFGNLASLWNQRLQAETKPSQRPYH